MVELACSTSTSGVTTMVAGEIVRRCMAHFPYMYHVSYMYMYTCMYIAGLSSVHAYNYCGGSKVITILHVHVHVQCICGGEPGDEAISCTHSVYTYMYIKCIQYMHIHVDVCMYNVPSLFTTLACWLARPLSSLGVCKFSRHVHVHVYKCTV